MANSIKALIVVLGLASVVFRLARPIALRFTAPDDYSRRRNIWFALTVTAFLSSGFWLFVLIAAPLTVWAARKDKNPIALYLLLMNVVPSVPVDIPLPGFKLLFSLDIYRLLAFCVLVPAAWRIRKGAGPRPSSFGAIDLLLIAYGLLRVILFVPQVSYGDVLGQDSLTNELRNSFLFVIDVYVLYYAVSRWCTKREIIVDAQAAFCLSCAVMAAIAVFETLHHWLLYADMAARWRDVPSVIYKYREGALRAEAASGNPLALGYLLAVAWGFWLCLMPSITSKLARLGVTALLWAGLLSTYSRGPWIGAVVIYLVFIVTGKRALPRLLKTGVAMALLIAALSLSPLGDRILGMLPFGNGSTNVEASNTITYRTHLAERSWQLIRQHPFFGDQLALVKLEDLRQGEGIIDIVNVYVDITLFYGFVGLVLFFAPMLAALWKSYAATPRMAGEPKDLLRLGSSLVCCIVGTLVMMATCSFILGYTKLFYVLIGFAMAYPKFAWAPRVSMKPQRLGSAPERS